MGVIRTLAAGLFVCASFAPAQEPDDLSRLREADAVQFAALAALDEPDPWLVASRLAAAGDLAIALRFAEAKPRPAVRGLARFLRTKPAFDEQVQLVRERVLIRLEDAETTRGMLAADLRAIEGVLAQANALERAQLVVMRGFIRIYMGDVAAGQREFLAAHEAATRLGWTRGAADALGTASENARVLYDYEEAVRLARQELALRWELADTRTTLIHLRRLTELMNEVGDAESARKELDAWSPRFGEAVELDRAGQLLRMADPDAALSIAKSIDSGRAHMLAGDALRQLAREADALRHYRRAIEKFEKDKLHLGHALGNAGISLLRLNRPRDARPLLERAQNEFDAAGDRGLVAMAVLHRGDAHLAANEAPNALRLFGSVRTFATRTGNGWLEAEALVRSGRARLALDDPGSARKSFSACREIAQELHLHELAAAGALGEARCFLRQGRPKLASAAGRIGRQALAPLVDGRPVPPGDEARRLHRELCAAELKAALALDSDAELWLAIERQRLGIPRYTRAQVEKIRNRAMTPAQIERERELRRQVARLTVWEDRARQESDRASAVRFKTSRAEAERELRGLVEAVQLRGRPGWELLFAKPASIASLRARLARDETLVSVAVAGDRAAALLVSPAEIRREAIEKGGALKIRSERVILVGPQWDLRWEAASFLRALSATEFALYKGRRATSDPVVLARPATPRKLRALFLEGSLHVLAPRIPVDATQARSIRKRVADGEALLLTRASHWAWWGKRN